MRSFDYRQLDTSVLQILEIGERTGVHVSGPIPLPTKRKMFTVIRSPHIDKKSCEYFEMLIHKRLIEFLNPQTQTLEEMKDLVLPVGVDIKIKIENKW